MRQSPEAVAPAVEVALLPLEIGGVGGLTGTGFVEEHEDGFWGRGKREGKNFIIHPVISV